MKKMSTEQQVDMSLLSIEDLLSIFIGILSSKALEHMGVPIKEGDEPKKDLRKASIAINSMSCLVDQLEPLVAKEITKQYRSLVSDLQLSYVKLG